jgi:hypothetical protein
MGREDTKKRKMTTEIGAGKKPKIGQQKKQDTYKISPRT